MDKLSMMQIAASAFGGALALYYLDRYREWKANRSELVISKDWRGKPVVDRKLKLFERITQWLFWIWVIVGTPILGYIFVTF